MPIPRGRRIPSQALGSRHALVPARRPDSDRDGPDRHRREPFLAPDQTQGEPKILRQEERVLYRSVHEDRGRGAEKEEGPRGGMGLPAEPVDQDARSLLPVLLAVRRGVKMQDGAEKARQPGGFGS